MKVRTRFWKDDFYSSIESTVFLRGKSLGTAPLPVAQHLSHLFLRIPIQLSSF